MKSLSKAGYTLHPYSRCVLTKQSKSGRVLTAVHVDDMLVASASNTADPELLSVLKPYGFKLESPCSSYVGYKLSYTNEGIHVSQPGYIERIAGTLGVSLPTVDTPYADTNPITATNENDVPVDPHVLRRLVGMLIFVAYKARPDVLHAVARVASHITDPCARHIAAAIRIYAYLMSKKHFGILYRRGPVDPCVYADASWGTSADARPIIATATIVAGGVTSAKSQRLSSVALSTSDAELMALRETQKRQRICWRIVTSREKRLLCSVTINPVCQLRLATAQQGRRGTLASESVTFSRQLQHGRLISNTCQRSSKWRTS